MDDLDVHKSGGGKLVSPSCKLSNGFILPEGKLTPNTLFVGGIDMKVNKNEIQDFFTRYGTVKEVKLITYRGGICKGYGFVYFGEDVNIPSIIEQQISFQGRKLKLGPAIMKERRTRAIPSCPSGPAPWVNSHQAPWVNSQCFYCTCCSPCGWGVDQPPVMFNGNRPYAQQLYSYSNLGGVMIPQMPVNYTQNAYNYQYTSPQWVADQRNHPVNQSVVDCGVQTAPTLLSI